MRGADSYTENLFSSVRLEDFVPANHPLRPIRTWVDVLPSSRTKVNEQKSAIQENRGHEEEQIQRGTDHWVPQAGRSRHGEPPRESRRPVGLSQTVAV
jgi:hypothetical protein